MSVHITKTYNIGGLIGLRQNAVKNAGETLGFKEMSLFKFPDAYDLSLIHISEPTRH